MRLIQPTEHPYKSIVTYDFSADDFQPILSPSDAKNISQTKITVNLLGKPQILIDGTEVQLRSARSFALIAYLCLELTPTPRNHIAELLWTPEQQPTNDRLRVLLSKLKKTAPNLVKSTTKTLVINKAVRQQTDAIRFLALHDEGTIAASKQAIESYTGDFLTGIEFEASSEFEKWLLHQQTIWREVLNFMYHQVIEELLLEGNSSNSANSAKDLREALFLAHKHTSIFPWSDEMIFKLAIIYIKKRQPDRALSLVVKYEERISKEFDVQLPPELQEIKSNVESAQIDAVIRQYPTYFN